MHVRRPSLTPHCTGLMALARRLLPVAVAGLQPQSALTRERLQAVNPVEVPGRVVIPVALVVKVRPALLAAPMTDPLRVPLIRLRAQLRPVRRQLATPTGPLIPRHRRRPRAARRAAFTFLRSPRPGRPAFAGGGFNPTNIPNHPYGTTAPPDHDVDSRSSSPTAARTPAAPARAHAGAAATRLALGLDVDRPLLCYRGRRGLADAPRPHAEPGAGQVVHLREAVSARKSGPYPRVGRRRQCGHTAWPKIIAHAKRGFSSHAYRAAAATRPPPGGSEAPPAPSTPASPATSRRRPARGTSSSPRSAGRT